MNKKQALARLRKPIDLPSLPKWKARVEIAKDVIAALELRTMRAERGEYLRVSGLNDAPVFGSLREQLPNLKCNVCAIGACFTALVARENNFDLHGDKTVWSANMLPPLREYFSDVQLGAMECAFEQCVYPCAVSLKVVDNSHTELFVKASKFCRYCNESDALIAIMQNVVENKGTFKP